mgnify:CR=1 FL=1
MKLALITDTHAGARSDSVPFDNFFRQFYIECFFPTLRERGIKNVVHLGDIFDRRKYINFNILNSVREYFFDQMVADGIHMDLIVGNHDTFFKNTNDVNSPDLLLKDYNNISVYSKPEDVEYDGTTILMMPWICTDNYQDCMAAIEKSTSPVMFGHLEIAGYQMYKGHDNDSGFDPALFSKFDLVCSGHFHHKSGSRNIQYLGNPYELTWADYDDPRGFHIYDTVTNELEFVPNPFTIFTKFWYNDTVDDPLKIDFTQFAGKHVKLIVVNKTDFYKFDQFTDRIYQHNPLELKIVEDMADYDTTSMDDEALDVEDTLTLLSQYCDSLVVDVDKARLKTLMRTLYVEAQNIEE